MEIIDDWGSDNGIWLKRACLVSHIPEIRAGRVPGTRYWRNCRDLAENRAPVIQRAIGWTLRELSHRHPAAVVEFAREICATASASTIREAIRKIPSQTHTLFSVGS
jgi:3-methyladenine DNA glycosylase AlkD